MGTSGLKIAVDQPADWEALRPGQFVVFLADTRTGVAIDEDGTPLRADGLIPVFNSLAEAQAFAQSVVDRRPKVCGQVYDYQGKAGDPVMRVYHASQQKRFDPQRRARNKCCIGGALLTAFVIWAMFGRRSNVGFFWFYLFGMKLLTIGGILMVRGLAWYVDQFDSRDTQR